jgi:hypothetical protein
VHQVAQLERYVQPAGQRSEPFAPGALLPQPVGLAKADHDVAGRQQDQRLHVGVGQHVGVVQDHPRIMVDRIQPEVADQLDRHLVQVMAQQAEQSQGGGDGDHAFERLENGDRTQRAAPRDRIFPVRHAGVFLALSWLNWRP